MEFLYFLKLIIFLWMVVFFVFSFFEMKVDRISSSSFVFVFVFFFCFCFFIVSAFYIISEIKSILL